MSYADIVAENQRLTLLQALEQDPDYSHNEAVLQRMLGALGHNISTDRLRTELHWLAEQDLVTVEEVAGLLVARLTRRGEDAALGRARIPGIARPRPGA